MLWVQNFRAKYLPDQELLTTTSYKRGTWAWHGIVEVVESLKNGACYLIHEGSLPVQGTSWLPTSLTFQPSLLYPIPINKSISDL